MCAHTKVYLCIFMNAQYAYTCALTYCYIDVAVYGTVLWEVSQCY